MSWYAKPKGGWSTEDAEAQQNMIMIRDFLRTKGWTDEAIAGVLGNISAESGFNPWRWNSDTVGLNTRAYGLVQFYKASYYIGGRGTEFAEYGPNMSVTQVTTGAKVEDGQAQLEVIEKYHSDKFLNRSSYCDYADISSAYPYSSFKTLNDLWIATVGWLFNYEFPDETSRNYEHAQARYQASIRCYEIITGSTPPTPPPTPPTPTPPTPPTSRKLPLYMYLRKV